LTETTKTSTHLLHRSKCVAVETELAVLKTASSNKLAAALSLIPRATRFQIESHQAVLSFPRKRESIIPSSPYWMPAFAGMTGNCVA
jgi:hypothetical protein